MREDNWPLLTVSKGFFETLATKGGFGGMGALFASISGTLLAHAG
jgi:hypothetical protein